MTLTSRISVVNLRNVCQLLFENLGTSKEDSHILTNSIIFAHTREKHTHGISRIPIYIRKINEGLLNPCTPITVTKDKGVVSLLDANNGFGQVVAIKAIDIAISKARTFGIGIVGVKNSNNFGTAGFIGQHAIDNGMIGIIFSNSGPAIAPSGGSKPLFGTNPICIAYPGLKDSSPIILDMSCSVAARGKIRLAAKNKENIPKGWALDNNGNETTDPLEALKGTMIPIGDFKGSGLALIVDLFAGMLTGSAFAGDAKNLNHPSDPSRNGHFIMVIDPEFFLSKEDYEEKIKYLIEKIKLTSNVKEVYLPGEKSYLNSKKNHNFINMKDNLIDELNQVLAELNISDRLEKIKEN